MSEAHVRSPRSWDRRLEELFKKHQFDLILFSFAFGYLTHWPKAGDWPLVVLGVAILFAYPLRLFFEAVPVKEALGAIERFAVAAVSGPAGAATAVATATVGPRTEDAPLPPLET